VVVGDDASAPRVHWEAVCSFAHGRRCLGGGSYFGCVVLFPGSAGLPATSAGGSELAGHSCGSHGISSGEFCGELNTACSARRVREQGPSSVLTESMRILQLRSRVEEP